MLFGDDLFGDAMLANDAPNETFASGKWVEVCRNVDTWTVVDKDVRENKDC